MWGQVLRILGIIAATSAFLGPFSVQVPVPFSENSALADVNRETTLDPQDVSILFPLPHGKSDRLLLAADSKGKHGELIPQTTFKHIPLLTYDIPENELFGSLRVVGARLDPCFTSHVEKGSCQYQIRLVLQPIIPSRAPDSKGRWNTKDAALHAFYDLNAREWESLLSDIKELKAQYQVKSNPSILGVHTELLARGLDSDYANRLKAIILSKTGKKRLSRLTFFVVRMNGHFWKFGGFKVSVNELAEPKKIQFKISKLPIANIARQEEDPNEGDVFVQSVARPGGLSAHVIPISGGGDTAAYFMRDLEGSPEKEVRVQLEKLHRIENPRINTPDTVDCFSCHAAQSARVAVNKHLGVSRLTTGSEYIQNIRVPAEIEEAGSMSINFRAFGYFGPRPTIGQRVINETHHVLSFLKSRSN